MVEEHNVAWKGEIKGDSFQIVVKFRHVEGAASSNWRRLSEMNLSRFRR